MIHLFCLTPNAESTKPKTKNKTLHSAYSLQLFAFSLSLKKKASRFNGTLFYFLMYLLLYYCASEILICIPPRVVVMGGEVEIFGSTRRCSKYSFTLTRLLTT
jgi:hypothetical protein